MNKIPPPTPHHGILATKNIVVFQLNKKQLRIANTKDSISTMSIVRDGKYVNFDGVGDRVQFSNTNRILESIKVDENQEELRVSNFDMSGSRSSSGQILFRVKYFLNEFRQYLSKSSETWYETLKYPSQSRSGDLPAETNWYLNKQLKSQTWCNGGTKHRFGKPAYISYWPDGSVERLEWFIGGKLFKRELYNIKGELITTQEPLCHGKPQSMLSRRH